MDENRWEVIEDCNDKNGEATAWMKKTSDKKYGNYIFITKKQGKYQIECHNAIEFYILFECNTLELAMSWVSKNNI